MSGGRRSRAGQPCLCCGITMTKHEPGQPVKPTDHEAHGYCSRDYKRWRDAGYPHGGPPKPGTGGRKGRGTMAGRAEDYLFLRSLGLTPVQIALRCSVTVTTVYRWAAAAREQAAP